MLRMATLPAVLVALGALLAPASSGGVGAPRCSTHQLRISVLDVQGATSHSYWDIALRNAGPGSCRLRGYPGVGLLDAHGRPIADEVRREPGFPTPSVTVAPGRRAYFTFGDVVAGPCRRMRSRHIAWRCIPPTSEAGCCSTPAPARSLRSLRRRAAGRLSDSCEPSRGLGHLGAG